MDLPPTPVILFAITIVLFIINYAVLSLTSIKYRSGAIILWVLLRTFGIVIVYSYNINFYNENWITMTWWVIYWIVTIIMFMCPCCIVDAELRRINNMNREFNRSIHNVPMEPFIF